jgi:hypothetical protein
MVNTMNDHIKLLDVVALTEDIPEHGLFRGQIGTVVQEWAPAAYQGREYQT